MRRLLALLFLISFGLPAGADTPTFKFGGESFIKKFEVKGRSPNAQIEFRAYQRKAGGIDQTSHPSRLYDERQ